MSILKAITAANHEFQVNKFFRLFIVIIFYILSCVAVPLLLFLWIPSKIYKSFVMMLVKVLCSDLKPISNPKSVIMSADNMYHNSAKVSIVTVATIDGYLSLTEITQLFEENVIHTCIQDKQLRYPELQEYPVSFLGYPFLKKESEFNTSGHISEYQKEGISFSETEIHQIMLNRPFQKFKSPWELVIFRNMEKTKSILALSIHHFLCDGRSVVKLFVEGLGKQKLNTTDAKFVERNWKDEIKYFFLFPFQFLKFVEYVMELALKFSGHLWQRQTFSLHQSTFYVSISPKIDMAVVRNVARVSGVQATSVLISAIIGGIEAYFETKKDTCKFSPKTLSIYLALPKECHPPGLTNHLDIGIPEVSIVSKNVAQRLKMCDRMYKNMRQSNHSRYFQILTRLVATYPGILRNFLGKMYTTPTGISNIAGEQNGFSIGGCPCTDFNMSVGMTEDSICITFTLISYKKHLQLGIAANGSVVSKEEIYFLGKLVENQLATLNISNQKLQPL